MSVRVRPEASGPEATGAAHDPAAVSPPDAAARLLGRLSVLPALLVMAWLLAGLPLLLAGQFTGVLMLVVAIPLAAIIVPAGLRWSQGRTVGAPLAFSPGKGRVPWWAVAGVILVAAGFGLDQMIYHSEFIIVTRDPGAYFQFATWIAHHHSLPIPQDQAAFGGTHGGALRFDSYAYYQVGDSIVPQFMAGLPMVLAAAFWTGGAGAAAGMGAILGACGVLAFGGLVARLVGARWAPLAALVLAISLPEIYTTRSTFSEPLAQILLFGGLCLLIDSLNADGVGARVLAGLAGLALGLTVLVRIDGVGDILPAVPYCGLLLLGRRRQAAPFLAGLVVGGGYGLIDGFALTLPYLESIRNALEPLALVAVLLLVVTVVVLAARWAKGVPNLASTWLPTAAAALVILAVLAFAVRPYVQTVRSAPNASSESAMAAMQRADGLPIDPTRMYYELSLHWVFWYIGVPAVILGTLGAALVTRRCLRGESPAWVLPLAIFAWATVTTLYQPSITPDQPWASRRLVPTVLPGFILLAVWAMSWLNGWLRRRPVDQALRVAVVACCALAIVIPAAFTTLGIKVTDSGAHGYKVAADGLAFRKTYQGQIAAVNGMCAVIPKDASVVFVNSVGDDESWLAEDVRGTCGVPVASLALAKPATVAQVVRAIDEVGRQPVLLGKEPTLVAGYGAPVRQIMKLRDSVPPNTLTGPPLFTVAFIVNVWMSEPSSTG
jgi:hypothetical protein